MNDLWRRRQRKRRGMTNDDKWTKNHYRISDNSDTYARCLLISPDFGRGLIANCQGTMVSAIQACPSAVMLCRPWTSRRGSLEMLKYVGTWATWYYLMILDDVDDNWCYLMISDDIWWYLMILDDSWWYLMIRDDIWCYLMIFNDIWLYLMIFDDIWWYLMIFDDTWWCLMMFHDIWWYLMIFDDIWWYLMLIDAIWWYLMIFDDIWWYLMISDDIWC